MTSNPASFKPKSNQTPPYDWSDITELAKQTAAMQLANSTDARTAPYWQMGATYSNDNNWIAVWFLYHKFRYRDGRNRAKDSKKGTTTHQKSGSDGKKSKSSSSQLGSASNRSSQSLGSPGMSVCCNAFPMSRSPGRPDRTRAIHAIQLCSQLTLNGQKLWLRQSTTSRIARLLHILPRNMRNQWFSIAPTQ